ncbi:hypothetical protein [Salinispora pacifica]|uniref:hypothetical protein n=1 Tax=Salinispora pacifica TaxID=351187 RepID=UPI000377CD85|nr:hypothetical protein [Salinispora pacifica]
MFGNGRRRTQSQLAKIELGRSFGHLKRAAGHATNGTGATVGPRVRAARSVVAPTALVMRDRAASGYVSTVAALTPLAIAVRAAQAEAASRAGAGNSTATSRKVQEKRMRATRAKKRSGRGRVTGLLAASVVVGLVGAMALRRRYERREWVEYDPVPSLDPMQAEMDMIEVTTRTPAEQTAPTPTEKVAPPAAGRAPATPTEKVRAATAEKAPATPTKQVPAAIAEKAPATPTEKAPATTEGKSSTSRTTNDLSKAMKNGRR